jgi:O-acetyl-ADP-ribose deacetylase (regulator of RNase III)
MEVTVSNESRITMGASPVRLVKDDITELEVEAFVYYATKDLALGSGFGGMITVRGGASIQKELDALGPVAPLVAVLSSAGKLKADHIIHAVGPKFREDDLEAKLLVTMENCLRLAEERGIRTLAFPAMGAGYYGIPAAVSARVMLEALQTHLRGPTGLTEVTICVLDSPQYKAFDAAMKAMADDAPARPVPQGVLAAHR